MVKMTGQQGMCTHPWHLILSLIFVGVRVCSAPVLYLYYGQPEGGPLLNIHLDIVTAFLWDSFFYRINIMLIFMN